MKLLTALSGILFIFCSPFALACTDEACKREAAEAKNNVTYPGYLTWKYCDTLKLDFMTVDVQSLEDYSSKHFSTQYKGPIKNIIQMIDQRKEWLAECDTYLSATRDERIFYDKATTDKVFAEMDIVTKELNDIVGGVTYSSSTGDETQAIVEEKFDALFRVVDNHKNLMHLKGKYVYQ